MKSVRSFAFRTDFYIRSTKRLGGFILGNFILRGFILYGKNKREAVSPILRLKTTEAK